MSGAQEASQRVLNRHHGPPPPGAVYIGRPSKWGNPFVRGRDGGKAEVIARYRAWVCDQPHLMAALPELRGRDLVCFCAPAACHGDVLLALANPPPMRLLVCGGRDYADGDAVFRALDMARAERGVALVIHGAARGADTLAARWAAARGVPAQAFPADWETHGRAAGHIRNARMLREGRPDGVIAFPGGRGTADMIRQAEAAGVWVWEPMA